MNDEKRIDCGDCDGPEYCICYPQSGSSACSVSVERSCETIMTLEHFEVRFGNKTAHVSRYKSDDCDYEFSFESVTHHDGSDMERITEDEKEMIRGELSDWRPLKISVAKTCNSQCQRTSDTTNGFSRDQSEYCSPCRVVIQ